MLLFISNISLSCSANDDPEEAATRGQKLVESIYSRIPGYNKDVVYQASPDYGWIVNSERFPSS